MKAYMRQLYDNDMDINIYIYTLERNQVEFFWHGIHSEPDPRNIPIVFAVQEHIFQQKKTICPTPPHPHPPTQNPLNINEI